jgi:hypothetical protein
MDTQQLLSCRARGFHAIDNGKAILVERFQHRA